MNPEFDTELKEAEKAGTEYLEDMAVDVAQFDPPTLRFLLKARKPEKYGDKM